jgi:predicted tellurium resistance membrane protein TerC
LLARLMNRFGWIIWIGGGVLGYVAGEMALADRVVRRWLGEPALAEALPFVLAAAIGVLGWWSSSNGRKKIPERV